jgi:2-succinyl-6-hydroxy-2,4-cyclohexadiene-1-carboxylate synthase
VLAARVQGVGPPLALVHGFTQTGRSWEPLAERLGRHHSLWMVDAPGHGGSAELELGLWAGARELVRTVGEAAYHGYSMGGRLCLHAALSNPREVQRLVLVGATAGIKDDHLRRKRRADDEALAASLLKAGDDGLPQFLHDWLAGPLFAGLDAAAQGLEARLENTAAGLASSLRLAGTGAQQVLDDRLGEVRCPTLLVVGEQDEKFLAEAERLRAGIRGARVAVIPGAGHACHLEQPEAFCDAVERFILTGTAPAPG